ncbi:MAG: glycosyltransferase family 39 protein [bacterium]|nr:glycosyltransferase family 39 protein [bacterium]
MKKKEGDFFIVSVILFIAFILRFYKLDIHSYRADEVERILFALKPVIEIFKTDFRSPMYCFILHWWIRIFSDSEIATRLLSVLLNVFTIIPLYALAYRLRDKKTAQIFSIFIAVSPYYILHSRVAENFSIFLLFISLSVLFFIKIFEDKFSIKNSIFYAFSTIFMLYSSPTGVGILLFEWVWFFQKWRFTRMNLRAWLIIQSCIFLVYTHWLSLIFSELYSGWAAFDRLSLKGGFIGRIAYAIYSFTIGQTIYPWNWRLVIPVIIIFVVIIMFAVRTLKGKYRTLSFIIPLFIIGLLPVFSNRGAPEYCIGASIAYYIFIAVGISVLKKRSLALGVIILIYLNGCSLFNLYKDREYLNQSFTDDWRKIAYFVNNVVESYPEYIKNDSLNLERNMPFTIVVYRPGPFMWYYKKAGRFKNKTSDVDSFPYKVPEKRAFYQPVSHNYPRVPSSVVVFKPSHPNLVIKKAMNANIIFVENIESGAFAYEKKGLSIFSRWLDANYNRLFSANFWEDKGCKEKKKLLKRDLPECRMRVSLYTPKVLPVK